MGLNWFCHFVWTSEKVKVDCFFPLTSSHQSSFGCQCILTCCVNMVVRVWNDLEKAKMMERLRKGRSSEGRRPTLEKIWWPGSWLCWWWLWSFSWWWCQGGKGRSPDGRCPTLEALPEGWRRINVRKMNGLRAKYYIAPSGIRWLWFWRAVPRFSRILIITGSWWKLNYLWFIF